MKNIRRKQILSGLALIILAVALFVDKLAIFTHIPILKIGMLLAFICIMLVVNIHKHSIVLIMLAIGLMATNFSKELGIEKIAPTYIIFSALLIGVGLSLIFGKKTKKLAFDGFDKVDKSKEFYKNCGANSVEYEDAEGNFSIKNTFGERTEYVSVKNLKNGKIENAMGSLTVYLTSSTIDSNGGIMELNNGLGKLSVYIPSDLRVIINADNGFGSVKTHGKSSLDGSKPVLNLKIENGFGSTDIYFE